MKCNAPLILAGLLVGCGAPDRPTTNEAMANAYDPSGEMPIERSDARDSEPQAEVLNTSQLDVDISYDGDIEGRLTVAIFPGDNPWGWSRDLRELNLPNFPEMVRFEDLEPGQYTVLAVLDAVPFDATNPGPEDRVNSVTLSLEIDENQVDIELPADAPEAENEEPEELLYSLTASFDCNCETLRDLTVSVHQNDEAPFRSREVINPTFPGTVDFTDLPEGSYRVRWTSTSLGGLSGEQDWTLPGDGNVIDFSIEIPAAEPTPDPVPVEDENERRDPADDEGQPEPEIAPTPEGANVDLEEEVDFPNRAEDAQDWTIGTTVVANLDGFRDFDWFRFTIEEESNLMIGTTGTTDTRCILNDVNGDRIANDDDSGEGDNCWLNLENLQPGTYLLRISHYSWWGNGEYRLVSSWMN